MSSTNRNIKIGVIGAGVIGLTTALEFQKHYPNADITVMAHLFNIDTTSDGAAGLFEPSPSFMGPDLETTRKWIKDSFEHYSSLLSQNCGVNELCGYALAKYDKKCAENHYLKPVLPVYRTLSEDELAAISPGDWKYGTYMSTLSIANRLYLPWCIQKFKNAGGKVINRYIEDFSELENDFDLIFNCTGLGAQKLCNDICVIPVRGQIVRIKCEEIKHFYMMSENGSYIIPTNYNNLITLGGTQDYGNYKLSIDKYNKQSILQKTSEVRYEIIKSINNNVDWVGLRPYRHHVKVEYEIINNNKIIHNYGHGGYGVTSAPGSAQHAVSIFNNIHKGTTV